MTDQYAVLGNPIAHSKSPDIHRQFATNTQQDIHYDKQLVELNGFTTAVKQFVAAGGKGLNITVPFKQEAYELADKLSKRARQAGAVNTLIVEIDGAITGDNTDGIGMVTDMINNHQWQLANKNILILGAGGAVRGVLGPILDTQPKSIIIANRTIEKARNLAQAFSKQGLLPNSMQEGIKAVGFDTIPQQVFDIIINGTSASLTGDLPLVPDATIGTQTCCYDMVYAAEPTPFLRWAKNNGCAQLADGLGMLVEQAAESFWLWRGIKPDTKVIIQRMR